jgi:hypothetical protein
MVGMVVAWLDGIPWRWDVIAWFFDNLVWCVVGNKVIIMPTAEKKKVVYQHHEVFPFARFSGTLVRIRTFMKKSVGIYKAVFWLPVPMAETIEALDEICVKLYRLTLVQLLGKGVRQHHYDMDSKGICQFYNDQMTKTHDVPQCKKPPISLWLEPVKVVSEKDSDLQTLKQIEAKHGMNAEQVMTMMTHPDELRALADDIEAREKAHAEAEKETVAEQLAK